MMNRIFRVAVIPSTARNLDWMFYGCWFVGERHHQGQEYYSNTNTAVSTSIFSFRWLLMVIVRVGKGCVSDRWIALT